MRPVERSEVMRLGDYEAIRPHFRARVIEEKKRRRVNLGEYASCVFENRDTVLMQIQEMLRTERITREAAIQHEIDTYNQLLGNEHEISATVMLEIDDREVREKFLAAASGIERHVALVVDGERCSATWDPERIIPGRASAVLYLKFPLSEKALSTLRQKGDATIELLIDHPHYQVRTPVPEGTRKSLAEDFDEPA
jgi:hypothetical protein